MHMSALREWSSNSMFVHMVSHHNVLGYTRGKFYHSSVLLDEYLLNETVLKCQCIYHIERQVITLKEQRLTNM